MRRRSIDSFAASPAWAASALLVLGLLTPASALAADDPAGRKPAQEGADRWVPSFAVTSGLVLQNVDGAGSSSIEEGGMPPTMLREDVAGNDFTVAPFLGVNLEVMTPTLPIPTSARLFAGFEILPSFGTDRTVAVEGDPGCIRNSEPGAPCASDETERRARTYGEEEANGQGTKVTSKLDTLMFGAHLGVAFPLKFAGRQLRIKPSAGWIHYKLEGNGIVSSAACSPATRCSTTEFQGPFPGTPPVIVPGALREDTVRASGSQRFNGLGPGLDVEMDAGRFGAVGVSLFLGARVYYVFNERSFSFSNTEATTFDDATEPSAVVEGRFKIDVDPWMYRGHVGIRFNWLGQE